MSKNKQRFWDLALALLLAAMLTGFMATEPATAGDRLRPYLPPPSPDQYQQQRPYPGNAYPALPPQAYQSAMQFRLNIQRLNPYQLDMMESRIRNDLNLAYRMGDMYQVAYLNLLLKHVLQTRIQRGGQMTTYCRLHRQGPLFWAAVLLTVFAFAALSAGTCWAKTGEDKRSLKPVDEIYGTATAGLPDKAETSQTVTIPKSEYAEYQERAHEFQTLQENHRHWFTFGAMASAVLCLLSVLCFIHKRSLPAKDSITLVGLVLVIFGVIILIQVVDSERQLTASIGVFGAVVGYLFGSVSARESSEQREAAAGGKPPGGVGPAGGKA